MNGEDKIDYIEIPARDPQAAREFFSALFGWQFEDYGPDYQSFTDGRIAGGFVRSDQRADTRTGSPLIVFYKDEIESATERVKALGGRVTKDVFSFPGGRRFHFTDPNGNEYAIWSDK